MKHYVTSLLLLMASLLISSCNKSTPTEPETTLICQSRGPYHILINSATFRCSIYDLPYKKYTQGQYAVYFYYSDEYATALELKNKGHRVAVGSFDLEPSNENISQKITGLIPNTKYYWIASVVVSDGHTNVEETFSKVLSFTTSDIKFTTNSSMILWRKARLDADISLTGPNDTYHDRVTSLLESCNSAFIIYSERETTESGLIEHGEKVVVKLSNDNSGRITTLLWGELQPGTKYQFMAGMDINGVNYYSNIASFSTLELPAGAIDLGMEICWGDCNIGAAKNNEYGDYYAWGEITTKTEYNQFNYKWLNNPKYTEGGELTLEPADDVAHYKLKGNWRMPTYYEWESLLRECTYEWTNIDGVNGYKFTGKRSGYTNSWIFFPAAGKYTGDGGKVIGKECHYWSSTLAPAIAYTGPYWSYYLFGDATSCCTQHSTNGAHSYMGLTVRGVYGL